MMTRLLILSLFCLIPTLANAQFNMWEPENGVPLRVAGEIRYNSAPDINNESLTLVAWSEFSENSRKIRTMIINSDGHPLWANPLTICNLEHHQAYPSVLALDNNEWIVAWLDYRNYRYDDYRSDLYLQKINIDGTLLYDQSGLLVCPDLIEVYFAAQLVKSAENGFIISWYNEPNPQNDNDIFAQRFDNSGNALWEMNGILIAGGDSHQGHSSGGLYKMASDGNDGAIFGFIEYGGENGYVAALQKINDAGELQWTDSVEEHLIISNNYAENRHLDLIEDGSGGAFVTWVDQYDDDWDSQIFAQHVDTNGNILWSEYGEIISGAIGGDNDYPKLYRSENGSAILSFTHLYNSHDQVIYLQKITGEDTLELPWGNTCVLIDEAEYPFRLINEPSVTSDGLGGAFVSWSARNRDLNYQKQLLFQSVDNQGNIILTEPLELHGDNDGTTSILKTFGEGSALAIWFGYLPNTTGIQYQVINSSGRTLLPAGGQTIYEHINGSISKLRVVDSGDFIYAAWIDNRSSYGSVDGRPYVQKIDHNGNILFEENGRCLAPGLNLRDNFQIDDCDSIRICPDNNGGVYTAWNQVNEYGCEEFAIQHVDANGECLWDNTGLVISNDDFGYMCLEDIIPIENDVLVFYTEYNEEWYEDLKCMLYSHEREPVWDEALVISSEESYARFLNAVIVEESQIIVSYYEDLWEGNETNLYLNSINFNGDILWTEALCFPVESIPHYASKPVLTLLNNNILFVWRDFVENTHIKTLNAVLLDHDGEFLWDPEVVELISIEGNMDEFKVDVADNSSYSFWVSYRINDDTTDDNLAVQRFNYDGQAIFEQSEGTIVYPDHEISNHCDMIVLSDNSVFLTWGARIEYENYDLKFTHLDRFGNVVNSAITYPENGAILSDEPFVQRGTKMIKSGDSGFISFWKDKRGQVNNHYSMNLYMMKSDDGFTGIREITVKAKAEDYKINKTWPNPFNPSINIDFYLAESNLVKIAVYDMLGREVTVLTNEHRLAGIHTINWNGIDFSGKSVASGTYFIRFESANRQDIKQISLIK